MLFKYPSIELKYVFTCSFIYIHGDKVIKKYWNIDDIMV